MNLRFALSLFALFVASASFAQAEGLSFGVERETVGVGRQFNNDWLGDGKDRWRSSSYVVSFVRAPEWNGVLPDSAGRLLEYRLRHEIVAPRFLSGAGSDDRPYAGQFSAGIHTHFMRGRAEYSLGADVVALGPQAGAAEMQNWFHTIIGEPLIDSDVIDNQIPNQIALAGSAEIAWPIHPANENTTYRPFLAAQAGVEEIARLGGDVIVGGAGEGALWLRDVVTGQLYRGATGDADGLVFIFGADYGVVGDSLLLPATSGVQALESRYRLRAAAHWQLDDEMTWSYGITYLSEEFVDQSEGQLVGSVKLNFNF